MYKLRLKTYKLSLSMYGLRLSLQKNPPQAARVTYLPTETHPAQANNKYLSKE